MSLNRRDFIAAGAAGASLYAAGVRAAVPKGATTFGVNCYDLFQDHLANPGGQRSPAVRLREIQGAGLKFVRFAASPFWPLEWQKQYVDAGSHEKYFARMDEVFKAAGDLNIALVPTLVWNPISVSDLNKEPLSAWADPNSRTCVFARDYVTTLLKRYGSQGNVLCWEFANEFNMDLDQPLAKAWQLKTNPGEGTPAQRTNADLLTTKRYQAIMANFQNWVTTASPGSHVSTGGTFPRAGAHKLSMGQQGDDTRDDHVAALNDENPAGGNFLSVHLYPEYMKAYTHSLGSYHELVATSAAAASKANNKLLVGEFGLKSTSDASADRAKFADMVQSIRDAGADYAALWVYDFKAQPEWNVTLNNERAWQIQMITKGA